MVTLDKFGAMAENFSHVADFIVVYTQEAHPDEKGDFNEIVKVRTHSNLMERLEAAKMMIEREPEAFKVVKVVVDSMENLGSILYATIPERQFIIHTGKIELVGGLGPFKHVESLRRVKKWLVKHEKNIL
jgi:ribosomal protein L14